MKKLYFILILSFFATSITSIPPAPPQKMSYQAVVRNASNSLITNQAVGVKISILRTSGVGTVVYSEVFSPNPVTNSNGLLTIEIGTGTPIVGTFPGIEWESYTHFIKTEIDPTGGTSYTITSTTQLLSVPYALHADLASTVVDGAITSNKLADNSVTSSKIHSMGATSDQALTYNGSAWLPKSPLWLSSGSDIYFNTGKIGVGTIPGSDLRKFQAITTNMIAVAGENNSATYGAIFGENKGSGPAGQFHGYLKILDGTQGAGKVLTSDVNGNTSWKTATASAAGNTGSIQFNTAGNLDYDAMFNWNKSTNRMGIGTPVPAALVEIQGTGTATAPQLLLDETSTANPARLHFNNGASTSYYWAIDSYNDAANANETFTIRNSRGGDMLKISGLGNIGIGTNPSSSVRLKVIAENQYAVQIENNSYIPTIYSRNHLGSAGNFINNSSTTYALYAQNLGAGPAAYFDGSLQISGGTNSEINRSQTSSANIVPICYGSVTSTGVIRTGASTSNFSVTKIATGVYRITITSETYITTTHCAIAGIADLGFINTLSASGNLIVYTYDKTGISADREFTFVVYKP